MMKLAILFRTHKATCCSLNHLPTRVLMGGHHLRYPLPYPLPGFFSTTLPEPYPKSKKPTRPSLIRANKILQQKVQVKKGSELAIVKHGEGHLG